MKNKTVNSLQINKNINTVIYKTTETITHSK